MLETDYTTQNGYEITAPVEDKFTAADFRSKISNEYHIDAKTPQDRVEQLKHLSVEGIAIMLEDINKSLQQSSESLMSHDKIMKIGDQPTIPLEARYEVFLRLVEDIKSAPSDVNPERVGDVLALGVVLLHPFHDGNGRTARALGMLFRSDYDDTEKYEDDFCEVTESRDIARSRGGFVMYGYTPRFSSGFDQSDPDQVSEYLSSLLQDEKQGAYLSPWGQASLHNL